MCADARAGAWVWVWVCVVVVVCVGVRVCVYADVAAGTGVGASRRWSGLGRVGPVWAWTGVWACSFLSFYFEKSFYLF